MKCSTCKTLDRPAGADIHSFSWNSVPDTNSSQRDMDVARPRERLIIANMCHVCQLWPHTYERMRSSASFTGITKPQRAQHACAKACSLRAIGQQEHRSSIQHTTTLCMPQPVTPGAHLVVVQQNTCMHSASAQLLSGPSFEVNSERCWALVIADPDIRHRVKRGMRMCNQLDPWRSRANSVEAALTFCHC